MTILKGASGAALYGSAAANGAIVITTKSGKAGRTRIAVSSDLTFESAMSRPELQFKYGQTGKGTATYDSTAESSWGPVVNAPDNTKDFYKTGVTSVSSVSMAGGTEKAQTYFSYGYTNNKGILELSSFKKHNFNFRETAKFLNDRLTADANLSFLTQEAFDRPNSGLYANPLTGLYIFPRGLNFDYYRNNYQYLSPTRNTYLQNWFDLNPDKGLAGQDHEQNPYWLLHMAPRTDKRDRGYGSLTLKYKFTDWLTLQARGNFDKSIDTYDSRMYAGTQSVQAAANGRYTYDRAINTQLYGDVILSANKQLNTDLHLQANVGSSITDTKLNDQFFDTDPNDANGGLSYANKFGLSYINASALQVVPTDWHKQQQAVFGSAELGYKDFLFVDLTGRNDWSSNFAFTPTAGKGYFYYSAGLNLVLSDALAMPAPVSFAKVRVSYARVGNDVPPYSTNAPQFNYDNRQGAQYNTKVPYPGTYLRPEDNRSLEAGTEWRFFNDRAGFDVTYYKNNNYRQYMEINVPEGTGFSTYYLNLGNIQNTGIEATAFVVPVSMKGFKWTTTINLAANKNRVIKLSDANIPGAVPGNFLVITGAGVNMYQSEIKEGGQWGDIYGYTFQRSTKDGSILVDATGAPQKSSTLSLVGNPNPKFSLGWNNSFEIANWTVNFLFDGRFGGKVMSVTQAVLDGFGDSKVTADARDAGGVNIKATDVTSGQAFSGKLPAQTFFAGVGGRAGISEYYMYDATAVRLRELAIGYKIPVKVKGITDMRFSLIGRNLFFISKKAPFDPELSMATNNGLQGIETFAIPTTRSIGASLKLGF
ncbi:SusC/RagA family TonB-linked outer membrane protein [Puia sp. P3]|uniref:SusC/RagA family TonB-linked outer membrane protein n=1 Tax=Puia sp. P3 TaxID=3423952 RepID=UPI003D676C63